MKTSSKKVLGATLVASILATAAVPAFAQPGGGEGHGPRGGQFAPMVFTDLDTNGDGVLTQEELDARKAARFAEADANGDGLLSVEEMMAQRDKEETERQTQRAERIVQKLDSDGDGLISAEELEARGENKRRGGDLFERADTNDDGQISEEEFETAMAKVQKRFGKGGERGGQGFRPRH